MDFNTSLYGMIHHAASLYSKNSALYFMGKDVTYQETINKIDRFANALIKLGVTKDDCVSICMPNVPQTIYALYAVNRIGAKCSIIHPLTPGNQVEEFMKICNSKFLIILDISYKHFKNNIKDKITIIASIKDELSIVKSKVYALTIKKDVKEIVYNRQVLKMKDLLLEEPLKAPFATNSKDTSVYLHSSGTTGKPKTIELSNYAINKVAHSSYYIMEKDSLAGYSMLCLIPAFHGFGLALNIHNILLSGASCALMPRYNGKQIVQLLNKKRINFIAGVPTLFEALLKEPKFVNNKNVKYIMQTFVGGDFSHPTLKERFNQMLKNKGSNARLLEGYGLTETVTVNAINRASDEKEGSVGKPFPGYLVKVIDVNTKQELKPHQEGEICIHCDTYMNGYLNDEETTKVVLNTDSEGRVWVHTGDFGYVDEDGFIYLKSRLKRIIKVSGILVFPSEIEKLVASMEEIDKVCAVGMEDEKKGRVIKLFVSLKNGYNESDELTKKIIKLCKENLIFYAVPKKVVYIHSMPLTPFNKIDYRELEKE